MSRIFRAAAAQMGPTQRADSREHTLSRMIGLLDQAAAQGAKLVVFPELDDCTQIEYSDHPPD